MEGVKWIKLATGLPDNKKIKQLRTLPNGDTIALMWIFLMCLAGETNEDGMVYFTREVPYTDEMLANQFDMDINTVRLGLTWFQKFGMIELIEDIICLPSWEKWQATDKLSEIREQTRRRVAKHREKQKLIASNVTGNVTVTQSNATEEDIELDIDKDIDNNISDSSEPEPPIPTVPPKKPKKKAAENSEEKPVKHKYGEYKNVLLTDEELEKLKIEYPDYLDRIERLSSYVESVGKKYKSHYATIRNWARNEQKPEQKTEPQGEKTYNDFNVNEW